VSDQHVTAVGRPRRGRRLKDRVFLGICIVATTLSVLALAILLYSILRDGMKYLNWDFLTSYPSRKPEKSGLKSALWGSVWLVCVAAIAAIPLGVATAIVLEEFKPRQRISRWVHTFIEINIGNLAGVPSIVYGVIGLTVFARMFGLVGAANATMYDEMAVITTQSGETIKGVVMSEEDAPRLELIDPAKGAVTVELADIQRRRDIHVREHRFTLLDGTYITGSFRKVTPEQITLRLGNEDEVLFEPSRVASYTTQDFIQFGKPESFFYFQLPLGPSILAGGLTLGLVILPIVIIASREALRAVPGSLREGAMALGCTRWQAIQRIVLPASIPGIMTGSILAMSRAIGEAAPLLMAGAFLFILTTPNNFFDSFAALPLQIFNWAGRPQEEFHKLAASGIIVLLAVLLAFNTVAIIIRQAFQKPLQ